MDSPFAIKISRHRRVPIDLNWKAQKIIFFSSIKVLFLELLKTQQMRMQKNMIFSHPQAEHKNYAQYIESFTIDAM